MKRICIKVGLAALGAAVSLAAPAHAGDPAHAALSRAAFRAEASPPEGVAKFTPRYADAPPPRIPGVTKTSVDYGASDKMMGSLGFLCGLKPGADRTGGGAITGYDPTGRFLGAKLRMAFR